MDELTNPLDRLWTFKEDRVYLLIAIARSKENSDVRATAQPTMRKVVESSQELSDKVEQLAHATKRFDQIYRLYATVNGRNTKDAAHFLQKEMLDARREMEKSGQMSSLLERVDHEWKSILHQPRCRDEKRFLFDLDTPSPEVRHDLQFRLADHTQVEYVQETPNGWHIITEPFNFTEIEDFDSNRGRFKGKECERKPDDMIFLGFL